jgi:hypothetical protein
LDKQKEEQISDGGIAMVLPPSEMTNKILRYRLVLVRGSSPIRNWLFLYRKLAIPLTEICQST